jgi:hypothetical protein
MIYDAEHAAIDLESSISFLEDFQNLEYVGKYLLLSNLKSLAKLSPYFNNTIGKAKFSFTISDFYGLSNSTYMTFYLKLFNGFVVNESVEFSSTFQLTSGVQNGIVEKGIIMKKEFGFIFTKPYEEQIKIDFRMEFSQEEGSTTK